MLGGDIKYKYLKLTVLICYYTFSSIGYIKKIKYLIRYIKLWLINHIDCVTIMRTRTVKP